MYQSVQAPGCQRGSCKAVRRGRGGERCDHCIISDVVKVEGEDLDSPDYLRGDSVRRDVGNFQSWVRPLWLARDENPELLRFHNIGLIKQSNTNQWSGTVSWVLRG